MESLNEGILKAVQSIDRKISPFQSIFDLASSIAKRQSKALSPLESTLRLSEIIAGSNTMLAFNIAQSSTLNVPKPFNPVFTSAMSAVTAMNKVAKKHQDLAKILSLPFSKKFEYLKEPPYNNSALITAMTVGSMINKDLYLKSQKFNRATDSFLKKIWTGSALMSVYPFYNKNYENTMERVINPFVSANLKFSSSIVKPSTLNSISDFEMLYRKIKNVESTVGGELANAIEETLSFDATTEDFNELTTAISNRLELVYQYIRTHPSLLVKHKKVILISLQVLFHTLTISVLLSVAGLLYSRSLSIGTDKKIDALEEKMNLQYQNHQSKIDSLEQVIESNFQEHHDSTHHDILDIQSKMDVIIDSLLK